MRYPLLLLAVLTLGLSGCGESSRHSASPATPAVLQSALDDIGTRSRVPVLIPTRIPEGVKKTWGNIEDDGNKYSISLYASNDPIGDAGDVAYLSGRTGTSDFTLPNTRQVQLKNGHKATFRPVSCGGSCAPANLWWNYKGNQYGVQLTLPSDMDEQEQQRRIIDFASSLKER